MRRQQDLARRDATAADLLAEHLRDHTLERLREHHADLLLPVGRELIDERSIGARRGRRVQRAEHQVTGLRRLDRDRDRLEITQLADQHDVRVFAQRRAQRVLERVGVHTDLALRDQALLVLMDELDRVFDGDDVVGARAVDEVDQRAERRGLARPGRPRDQHEPLGELTEAWTSLEIPSPRP